MTIKQAYKMLCDRLCEAEIEDYAFEVQYIFEEIAGYDRAKIISFGNDEISEEKLAAVENAVNRRINREPLQYILGKWSFCGFNFEVGEGVLIPRDDTEVLVNLCLKYIKNLKKDRMKILDLCAGSGAISIALERLTGAEVTAVELSDRAFEYLKKNIELNHSNVRAVKGDIFKCSKDFTDSEFDLIVSNPPYIKSDEIDFLQEEVRREPKLALDGGKDGYDFYRAIIPLYSSKLSQNGAFAFELGENQYEYVKTLMINNGFENISYSLDLGGIERAVIGIKENRR